VRSRSGSGAGERKRREVNPQDLPIYDHYLQRFESYLSLWFRTQIENVCFQKKCPFLVFSLFFLSVPLIPLACEEK